MLIVKKKKDAFASTLKTFLKEITCGGRKMQSFLGEQNSTEFFGQRKPNFANLKFLGGTQYLGNRF